MIDRISSRAHNEVNIREFNSTQTEGESSVGVDHRGGNSVGPSERRTGVAMKAPLMARKNKSERNHGTGTFSLAIMVICIAVGLTMAMACFLYLSVLVSPGLLRRLLQDVMQCEEFGYLAHNVESSRFSTGFGGNELMGPGTDHHKTRMSRDGRSITVHCCACEADSKEGTSTPAKVSSSKESKPITVLIGILTQGWKIDRRNILRLVYGVQASDSELIQITVRFVLGAMKDDRETTLVGMENATYGDIIVLGCKENINDGKTFTYFSTLPGLGVHYDYVMKTDDDSYVRVENLGTHLKPLPRTELYYGYVLPCENTDPYTNFMAGMGYVLSWDLVVWIRESPIPRNNTIGLEDKLVAEWFNAGGKAKNRVTGKPLIYDHPDFPGRCAHELTPDTILVHHVKTTERWYQVMAFFEKDRISRGLAFAGSSMVT